MKRFRRCLLWRRALNRPAVQRHYWRQRQLKENDHRRTVVLLWTAGHFQNLTGMRHLTPLLLTAAGRRDMQTVSQKDRVLAQRLSAFQIRFAVGLDLSMQSRLAGIFRPGFPLS